MRFKTMPLLRQRFSIIIIQLFYSTLVTYSIILYQNQGSFSYWYLQYYPAYLDKVVGLRFYCGPKTFYWAGILELTDEVIV